MGFLSLNWRNTRSSWLLKNSDTFATSQTPTPTMINMCFSLFSKISLVYMNYVLVYLQLLPRIFPRLFDYAKGEELYSHGEESILSTHMRGSLTTPKFIYLFSLLPPPWEMCNQHEDISSLINKTQGSCVMLNLNIMMSILKSLKLWKRENMKAHFSVSVWVTSFM